MRLREVGELGFLRLVHGDIAGESESVLLGVGDDGAVVACCSDRSLVLTCDAATDGRHFQRQWFSPEEIGGRAVAAATSDLAAMGARPAALLLTLLVSPDEDVEFARAIVRGAAGIAEQLGAQLVGGETVGTDGPLSLDVLAAGFVPVGRELRRSAAQHGDTLLVSGTLGDSAAGLAALKAGVTAHETAAYLISRYKAPQPRVLLGPTLAESAAVHAAIDISDGLLRDAGHVAGQSGVALHIDREAIPLSPECHAMAQALSADPFGWALGGGEDFELLFTAEPAAVAELVRSVHASSGLSLTCIGEVREGEGVHVHLSDGTEVQPSSAGWDQFSDG